MGWTRQNGNSSTNTVDCSMDYCPKGVWSATNEITSHYLPRLTWPGG